MQSNPQMPHDLQAEMSVLGALLYDERLLYSDVPSLEPNDFFDRRFQEIYSAILKLNENNKPVDSTTVLDQLQEDQRLQFVDPTLLVDIMDATPTIRNYPDYVEIVKEHSTRRRMIDTAELIITNSQDPSIALDDVLTDAETAVMAVSQATSKNDFRKMDSILPELYQHAEEINKTKGEVTGIPSGYRAIDNMTSGFGRNDLIILAARPSMGKTAFALNIAEHVGSSDRNYTVALFSLEMGAEQLVSRMIAAKGNLDATKLRRGGFDREDWAKFQMAIRELSKSRIFIDDTPGIRINEIRSKCVRLKQQEKQLDMIIIDYLQLIQGSSSRRNENRQQEVSEISRMLKGLAREIGCPVIALSQLSRGVESRQDKRPMMSDLRESGSIEQDADIVSFLYRDDYYSRGEGEEGDESQLETSEVEVLIAKHRNGPTGTAKLIFNKKYSKFLDQENFDRDF